MAKCPKTLKSCSYSYRYLKCRCDCCKSYHNSQRYRDISAKERARIWRLNNLEKSRSNSKSYQHRHPAEQLNWKLKKYGLSGLDYRILLIKQGIGCAICQNDNFKNGKVYALDVDHCHTTGKVRGLLCNQCNTGLGKLRHSVKLLQKAIAYLNQVETVI